MCGLAGALIRQSKFDLSRGEQAVRAMCDRMSRRGPDAAGYWRDETANIVLGHRRLAILDLSSRANQPMVSQDGRYVIIFNGEIYNFLELRVEMERDGEVFQTRSDTEVLLKLFAREGKTMLGRLRGMFAIVIWDRRRRRMFIARDPYGIKPLYFAATEYGVFVASQVKALLATGLISREPDPSGQAGYWLLGSVPEPRTWFRDIRALPAGCCTTLTDEGAEPSERWSDIGAAWRDEPRVHVPSLEVRERVRAALVDSVKAHLVSDVPVGVFLSGGIDSGSIAALMVEAGAEKLLGVTLAFDEFTGRLEDEAPPAEIIAKRYDIAHHIRRVTRAEFHSDLPSIVDAMDQPTIDGVNTWYASKAVVERGLKVVVSGVGGDELFQGYPTFRLLPRVVSLWDMLSRIPGGVPLGRFASTWQARWSGNPRWKLAPKLLTSIEGAWFLRRGLFSIEELPALMGEDLAHVALRNFNPEGMVRQMSGDLAEDPCLAVGQIESMTFLRNQLLRDSDWASMAHSVELRTPLVDAKLLQDLRPILAEFHRFPNKRLLAEAPTTPLPNEVIMRTKTGFGIPAAAWGGFETSSFPVHKFSCWMAKRAAANCYGQ